MPKRVGFLYEKVLTLENCQEAVMVGTKNLKKTKKVRWIRSHPEEAGQQVLDALTNGWKPGPVRLKTINEGSGHKKRFLKIPSTFDHLCHVAIMLPLIPLIQKRMDFYCCGSVPGRGQKRADMAVKTWMNGKKVPKYAGEGDVHHAYQSTRPGLVMAALRRIVKDERYLHWHELILGQMGDELAIGFQPSHWYFNLVMDRVDKRVRREIPGIKYVRFMDNIVIAHGRKRTCHRAMRVIEDECRKMGMELNRSKQVYHTAKRSITLLSYRYFKGYSILRKATMYRISKGIRRAGRNMCDHHCRAAMSLIGITRHCNSYNFRKKHVYKVMSIKQAKGVISHADKKRNLRRAA